MSPAAPDDGAVVWIDGQVVDAASARIPITDHGLLYGDGLFEGLRVVAGGVFRLDRHLARFEAGAKALALELPGGIRGVREVVLEKGLLPADQVDEALDVRSMTEPGLPD